LVIKTIRTTERLDTSLLLRSQDLKKVLILLKKAVLKEADFSEIKALQAVLAVSSVVK
jgi:hypothetical protein